MFENIKSKRIFYLGVRGLEPSILSAREKVLGENIGWNCDVRADAPLRGISDNVEGYFYCERYALLGQRGMCRELLDKVRKFKPDFIVWISMNYEIPPEAFDRLREFGAVVCGWFFDDEVRFDNYSKYYAPHLDFILTTDFSAVDKYRNMGLFAEHFLVVSTPEVFIKKDLPREYDVVFIGRKFGDRGEQVSELIKRGMDVQAWGNGWDNGYISFDGMIDLYNKSRISLCFTKSYGTNSRPQLKDKIFDVISCGGFLLCEYMPGIEKYFEPGKEIACFNDIDDLEEKIRYYLPRDAERKKIAEAGRNKYLKNFTQAKLFADLFSKLDSFYEGLKGRKNTASIQDWSHDARELAAARHLKWADVLAGEFFPSERVLEEIDNALRYTPSDNAVIKLKKEMENEAGNLPGSYGRRRTDTVIENNFRSFMKKMTELKDAVSEVFENMSDLKINDYAIFGAGKHTVLLLKSGILPSQPKVIFDENPLPGDFMGLKTAPLSAFSDFNMKGILVSSDGFEDIMCRKITSILPEGIPAWRLYRKPLLFVNAPPEGRESTNYLSRPLSEKWDGKRIATESLKYFGRLDTGSGVRYSLSSEKPVLYSLAYKILTDALLGRKYSIAEKRRLSELILKHYCDDGLFRDSAVSNDIAEDSDWWGWRHLTCHVLPCLTFLGVKAGKGFECCEKLIKKGVGEWLSSELESHRKSFKTNDAAWAFLSNKVMNYGVMLQYARDFQGNEAAGEAVRELLDSLDSYLNERSALYEISPDSRKTLSNGVQAGYHFWLLYFYDRRPLKYLELTIDRLLESQNANGGFGVRPDSSACEDIDSIDPLCRLYFMTSYRGAEIKKALALALPHLLSNWAESGGFFFRENEPMTYGHELMSSQGNEAGAFPTWFRLQSMAFMSKVLKSPELAFDWKFIDCPGMTFWRPVPETGGNK